MTDETTPAGQERLARYAEAIKSTVLGHHPRCYQVRPEGIPDDLPRDLCDCRILWMLTAGSEAERTATLEAEVERLHSSAPAGHPVGACWDARRPSRRRSRNGCLHRTHWRRGRVPELRDAVEVQRPAPTRAQHHRDRAGHRGRGGNRDGRAVMWDYEHVWCYLGPEPHWFQAVTPDEPCPIHKKEPSDG